MSWQEVPLGEVLTLHYGKALPKGDRNTSGDIPLYGANGIKEFSDQSLSAGPSLIIGRKGSAGKITRVEGPFWPLDVTYFTEHDDARVDFDFLEYALRMMDLPSLAKGVKPGINRNEVYGLPISLPPLEEQKRIAAMLDQAVAALDRARANAESNLADAEEVFENWRVLIFERRGREWQKVRLPDISENLDRQRVPITKSDRVAGSVPYYGASGVVDHVADHLFDDDLLLVSEDGANLLARTYPIAFSISGKSWVNNHAHVLRFEDRTDQEFVRLYLESISLKPFVSGMAQPKLNQKALNKIPIPFPDAAIRQDIVEEAERIAALTTRAVKHYEEALEDNNDLRLSILSTAFAGRLL